MTRLPGPAARGLDSRSFSGEPVSRYGTGSPDVFGLAQHSRLASVRDDPRVPDHGGTGLTLREMVLGHADDIDELLLWKAELRGAFRLMTLVMGTSLISLVISILTIIALVADHRP